MTGNLYIDFAISIAGIALMVGVSWLMGAWRSAPIDEAAAMERLAFDEPDFEADRWRVAADRKAAAALSAAGDEIAFILTIGDSLATRRLKRSELKVRRDDKAVVAETGDPAMPKIRLAARDAAEAVEWAGELGG